VGGGQDAGGERGVFARADSVAGDADGVYHTNDKMSCLLGVWGEPGGWNGLWGCSEDSSSGSCRFRAEACGLERGRVGDTAVVDKHVDSDVAVALHISGCSTGDRGTGWGEPGAVGGLLAVRL
jgi:hypothetical protein